MTDPVFRSPVILYKYLPPERVDVVANGLLRYTQLGAFNDPFDGRPQLTALGTDEQLRESLALIIPEENRRAYGSLSAEVRAQIPFEVFSALAISVAKHGTPSFMEQMRNIVPSFQEWFHLKMDEYVGVLSLSALPDNLLMWSHYSFGHTGFALGFDGQHTYFNSKLSESDELRHIREVLYREERTQAPLSAMNGVEMFFVKSAHWVYEREWRILRPLADAEVTKESSPFPIHLFRFPDSALRQIIFGPKMDHATKRALITAVKARSSLQHVTLKQAVLEKGRYALSISNAAI
jgi:hypothetical protein